MRPQFDSWVRKFPWRRNRLPTPVFLGFPGGSDSKDPPAMWETWVQSLGWRDSLEEGHGNPFWYSCLENQSTCTEQLLSTRLYSKCSMEISHLILLVTLGGKIIITPFIGEKSEREIKKICQRLLALTTHRAKFWTRECLNSNTGLLTTISPLP